MSGGEGGNGGEGGGNKPPPPLPPLARPVKTRPTSWDPASAKVVLNVSLDACFVPTLSAGDEFNNNGGGGGLPGPAGCRAALSHVVVGLYKLNAVHVECS
jgi:hypothetical protein